MGARFTITIEPARNDLAIFPKLLIYFHYSGSFCDCHLPKDIFLLTLEESRNLFFEVHSSKPTNVFTGKPTNPCLV
jgi:hypothetical protein